MAPCKRILIVDDFEDNLCLIQCSLEELGCEIDAARSVNEGIERINAQAPDLVLVDLMMPDAFGGDLVTYIRQKEAIAKIPIILMTAYVAFVGARVELEDVTAVFYKPFDIDRLKERVQQLLWQPELVECSV